jgi:hypothetical protein
MSQMFFKTQAGRRLFGRICSANAKDQELRMEEIRRAARMAE